MYEIIQRLNSHPEVGHYDNNGKWIPYESHINRRTAERQAAYLNAKAIQKAKERAVRNTSRNRNRSNT